MCHVSHVTSHMSHVTSHVSNVIFFFWGGGGYPPMVQVLGTRRFMDGLFIQVKLSSSDIGTMDLPGVRFSKIFCWEDKC